MKPTEPKDIEPDTADSRLRMIDRRASILGQTEGNSVPDILHAVRRHLKMEVAFVSEFVDQQRVFRYVDSNWSKCPVHVGASSNLETSYCQRVVDGRLPELIPDAKINATAADLNDTFSIPIGAHISVPIMLPDGSVYGTFCCFSRTADFTLNQRDLSLMRLLAEIAGKIIDKERQATLSQRGRRQLIEQIFDSDTIRMVYQPIFQLGSITTTGFEALARFGVTPARSPDLWFRDAHAVGLGVALELRAMEQALETLDRLTGTLDLAINASPETILDARFDALLNRLPSLGRLVLEITEHTAVEQYETIATQLKPYRERGLQIAVDDAGAGYASFRHILNLEPDRIKLDMSLTRDIDTDPARRALAAAFVHFSIDTGSKLIAEGVETAAEAATLMDLGIENGQGYFLGRPVSMLSMQQHGYLHAVA